MHTREELLLRKSWAYNAYKTGRIPNSRYQELINDIDAKLNSKNEHDSNIMKTMFNKIKKEYVNS